MDTSSQISNNNIQVQVLLMAFHSLSSEGQETFLKGLREEIEDAALLKVLEERSQNATILSDEQAQSFRDELRSA
ncbi:MAG: hypothetical protein QNJ31_06840 [Candidatus Caenarcaniphilales bacterium]|nr:hypothetical protein [Candidatus Caenarcaniphilales bacterium]